MYWVIKLDNDYGKKTVYRNEEGFVFEADEDNRHYRQYLAWLAEGNEPTPADE